MAATLPALYVSLGTAKRDPALAPGARGARKLLVTKAYPQKERSAVETFWEPPSGDSLCPVLVTRDTEVAIFNEHAAQDRHRHEEGTEIYMVLEGRMLIEVEGDLFWLAAGDMIVINPGSCHQVKPEGTEFLCRVLTANCGGPADKYVLEPASTESGERIGRPTESTEPSGNRFHAPMKESLT